MSDPAEIPPEAMPAEASNATPEEMAPEQRIAALETELVAARRRVAAPV